MNPIRFAATTSWADAMNGYPDDVRLEIYDAIFVFVATGKTPKLSAMAQGAFGFIKQDIEIQRRRADAISAKRSEAGRNGANIKNNKL